MIALQAMRMWVNLHTYDKRHVDTDSCKPIRVWRNKKNIEEHNDDDPASVDTEMQREKKERTIK